MSDTRGSEDTAHHKFITEAQVKAVLKKNKGNKAEVSSWKIEDFTKKGDNFTTDVTSIKVLYSLNGSDENISYVVKISKDYSLENVKSFIDVWYFKEKEFYEEMVPDLNSMLTCNNQEPLRVPAWIYSAKEDGKELMYFEDLRLRGFKMLDRENTQDVSHSFLVLREMARFHAASVLFQEKCSDEDLTDKYPLLKLNWHNHSEKAEELFNTFFHSHFDNAIGMLKHIGGYEVAEDWLVENKPKSFDNFKRLITRQAPFDAICHGDIWNNNILFRYNDAGDPVEVMLLDWQANGLASLGNDLAYFLFTTVRSDLRKNNLNDLLASYYDTFQQVLKPSGKAMSFTQEELLKEYKKKSEFGLLFSLFSIGIIMRPPDDMPNIDEVQSEEDMKKMMAEWRKGSLKSLDENPMLRPRFLSLFDDMIEYGVIG